MLDSKCLTLGNTTLSNLFILDFMPIAKGDYLKVYLYGLMYASVPEADITMSIIAKELGLDEDEVMEAFAYWERKRLVIRLQDKPPVFKYVPMEEALSTREAMNSDRAYTQFADCLYSKFGGRRKLHGGETSLAFEWVEDIGLPAEIVIMLIQYMIDTKGINFSFKAAQKLAIKLKENNIQSINDADHYFSTAQKVDDGAKSILRRFRDYRNPTEDEIALYKKWIEEWNLSKDAILAACSETTKGKPSFAYLDGILKGLMKRSNKTIHSGDDVITSLKEDKKETAIMAEMLNAVGMQGARANITQAVKTMYYELRKQTSHEFIIYVASKVHDRGGKLDNVQYEIEYLIKQDVKTLSEAKRYYSERAKADKLLRKIYDSMGLKCEPNNRDRGLVNKWRNNSSCSGDLMLKAAEYSRGKNEPFIYMNRVLQKWQEKGITTPESAIEAYNNYQKQYSSNNSKSKSKDYVKRVPEQQYSQRSYTEEDFDIWMPDDLKDNGSEQ